MHQTKAAPLLMFKMNTKLFINSFTDVDDRIAHMRNNNRTNSMIFIACHLLDARFFMSNYIGAPAHNPYQQLFDKTHGTDNFSHWPPLEDIISLWEDISPKISSKINSLHINELKLKSDKSFPIDDDTKLGGISFLIGHESYHIGQLGLLRKYYGLDPVKYS